jgi:hypothetical protein
MLPGRAASREQWWNQHHILLRELQCKPWEWPCVQRPGTGNHLEAQARYRFLEAALRMA